jgi:DNA-binding NtrC family response regulator
VGVVPLQELDMGPIRVLLVEDELFVRIDIAATLRHAGFQVIESACADAAMEFIESGEPIIWCSLTSRRQARSMGSRWPNGFGPSTR